MTTLVGNQKEFADALQSLLELDYDAIEAYKTAIERLDAADYKARLKEFCADHERHVREITEVFTAHDLKPAGGPDAKQWLTKGKVVLANLLGDKAILKAMLTNEEDTNTAYERMHQRKDIWPDARDIISRGWDDEKRHKAWIEQALI